MNRCRLVLVLVLVLPPKIERVGWRLDSDHESLVSIVSIMSSCNELTTKEQHLQTTL